MQPMLMFTDDMALSRRSVRETAVATASCVRDRVRAASGDFAAGTASASDSSVSEDDDTDDSESSSVTAGRGATPGFGSCLPNLTRD